MNRPRHSAMESRRNRAALVSFALAATAAGPFLAVIKYLLNS